MGVFYCSIFYESEELTMSLVIGSVYADAVNSKLTYCATSNRLCENL